MSKNISKKQNQARKKLRKESKTEQNGFNKTLIIPVILAAVQLISCAALIIALKRLNLPQSWQLILTAIILLALEVAYNLQASHQQKSQKSHENNCRHSQHRHIALRRNWLQIRSPDRKFH